MTYRLQIVPAVPVIEFQDFLGNWASRFEISQPYKELTLTAESTVALSGCDPFAFTQTPNRPSFPLVWAPWERIMLSRYLAPVELPGKQLRELYDYAKGFVENNNYDLLETLFEINLARCLASISMPGQHQSGDHDLRGVHPQARRLPGFRQFVYLHGPPARSSAT